MAKVLGCRQQRHRLVSDQGRQPGLELPAVVLARLLVLVLEAGSSTLARPTWLPKAVFSCLRQTAGGLLARRGGLDAGRGGHQELIRESAQWVP